MLFPAWRARSRAPVADDSDFDEDAYAFEFEPGERICPPRSHGGSSVPGAILIIVLMLAAGWGFMYAPAEWLGSFGERVAAVATLFRTTPNSAVTSDPSTIATADAVVPAAPMPEAQVADAPPVSGEAVPNAPPTDAGKAVETGSIDPASAAPPAPLPPPRVDPGDPYQKRAVAVGLHPDLSRVLLRRMTSTDYRNAGYAIDTAIAKTADESDFIWPRQRKPEQALFRVHFVRGAAVTCRRYVVTVTKDGWTTTAPPMERCGAKVAAGNRSG
ncbi:hypothetical protein GIW81_08115 [Hyphomicrobium sp. xq]|uniref:Uncharacterized protein n=1 Tax=Hyphomicrobium album TaxID=2665159 RepID=A0A6I3KIT5_9HYPH|nr:hypothetical protein [Hyphomicrobium album]MTD94299.1 hypothetical protein [Hyphomicrobium album]